MLVSVCHNSRAVYAVWEYCELFIVIVNFSNLPPKFNATGFFFWQGIFRWSEKHSVATVFMATYIQASRAGRWLVGKMAGHIERIHFGLQIGSTRTSDDLANIGGA